MWWSGWLDARRRRGSPPALEYVFVVTYGRSGSTLVQGLLNTLPRTLVRGENNFYVLPFFRAKELAGSFQETYGGPAAEAPKSAFFGLNEIALDDFAEATRALVVKQLLRGVEASEFDRVGFKEVLWHRVTEEEQAGFFEFMESAFPGVKYLLNQRDHDAVSTSGFWQHRSPESAQQAIARTEEIQAYLRTAMPDRVFDTRYETLTSGVPEQVDAQLCGLAEFVTGSCDAELLEALRHTLTVGHGPNPFGKSRLRGRQPREAAP